MSAPREGLMRPLIRVSIEVCPAGLPAFVGTLKAVMYQHGAIHHYRVADESGVLWLAPPTWLPARSLQVAEMAVDHLGSRFLHAIHTVPPAFIWLAIAKVTEMPDGLTPDEMVARLAQRKIEETVA